MLKEGQCIRRNPKVWVEPVQSPKEAERAIDQNWVEKLINKAANQIDGNRVQEIRDTALDIERRAFAY